VVNNNSTNNISPPPIRSSEPRKLSDFVPSNLPTRGASPSSYQPPPLRIPQGRLDQVQNQRPAPSPFQDNTSFSSSNISSEKPVGYSPGGGFAIPGDIKKNSYQDTSGSGTLGPQSTSNEEQSPQLSDVEKELKNQILPDQGVSSFKKEDSFSSNTVFPAPKKESSKTDNEQSQGLMEPTMLRSSIRTMKSDLESIKKSEKPKGIEVEKMSELDDEDKIKKEEEAKERGAIQDETLEIELGEIERSKSIDPERPRSFTLTSKDDEDEFGFDEEDPVKKNQNIKEDGVVETSSPKQSFSVRGRSKDESQKQREQHDIGSDFGASGNPASSILGRITALFNRKKISQQPSQDSLGTYSTSSSGGGLKIPTIKKLKINPKLIIVVIFLLALGGGGWYFINQKPEFLIDITPPLVTPDSRPTPTQQPATPSPISDVLTAAFGEQEIFKLDLGVDPLSNFTNFIKSRELNEGEIKAYVVHNKDNIRYRFDKLLSQFLVKIPNDVLKDLNQDNFIMLVFNPGDDEENEIGFVIQTDDSIRATANLRIWEGTMSDDFEDLFDFDVQRASSPGFLDNVHEGITIRYRNFPDPIDTIDYSVITMANGDSYLIIINSKKSIYNIIDRLLESGAK